MAHSIDPATGAVRGFVPARNDEERYLMRHIEDLADAAFSRGIARCSAFLSDREQDLARAALGRVGVRDGWRFDGGWPEAERRVLCLEPEHSYGECPVRCVQLQCRALPGAGLPAHKDYLGSLMGLALKREALGDILLPADAPGTAYVFALEPAAKLICRELCQAGRTEVSTRLLEPEEIPAFPAPEPAAHRHRVLPAAGRGTLCHAARQPRHRCGTDRGGQGRDQPSAGRKAPCSRIRAGCVHRARQGPLPADCIAREK